MSKANRRIAATVTACLAAGLLFLGWARAEAPDPLKDAAARQKVAADAAERDIRTDLDDAYKMARAQPSKAIERIHNLLKLVEVNPYFSDERRDALTALLKKDLIEVQKSPTRPTTRTPGPASIPFRATRERRTIRSGSSTALCLALVRQGTHWRKPKRCERRNPKPSAVCWPKWIGRASLRRRIMNFRRPRNGLG